MPVSVSSKVFDAYQATLAELRSQGVTNEEGLRPAFQSVLTTLGKEHGWTLVLERRLPNGTEPDGTLLDSFRLPRGYWEAKDSKDDLEKEIQKKITRGYPLTNTIFEDSRRAILYQQGRRVLEATLTDRRSFTDLLTQFLTYTEPDIERFDQAVLEFKERIPELAQGVLELIRQERRENAAFIAAFDQFHALCKEALNPHISVAAIEEMLVQHLFTERLFRTVFDNPDFTQRNVIAREVERVIQALTSRAFNRAEFLRRLDRFYGAIEVNARGIADWTEKQHFLNTVYERFFQGFAVKQADTLGIVYTPQEIVDFMVASVEEVVQREFGKSLSTPGVKILDPCTGTGNFIVNILRCIAGSALRQKYTEDLFANEIMLLPYYIAALNIEHAYFERTGQYLPFEGLCFTDTLDLAEGQQMQMFVEANTERVEREKAAPVMVVIGNPPYNVGQVNENDNNKNRRYDVIDQRIRETYAKSSKATLNTKLYDAYVKFFRWATDRLGDRDGIVCFVSNNSFVHKLAFDGMRQHLAKDFTSIYHLDLGGDVRERGSGNVFGIMVGVGITLLIRHRAGAEMPHQPATIFYHKVPEEQKSAKKLAFLRGKRNITDIEWQELQSDSKYTWLTEGLRSEFDTFLPLGTKAAKAEHGLDVKALFKMYSLGVATNRDEWAYAFSSEALNEKMQRFIKNYNREVFRWSQEGNSSLKIDDFVNNDPAFVKWTDKLKEALHRGQMLRFETEKVRYSLYRPFCKQYLYFDDLLNQRRYQQHTFFPTSASEIENVEIVMSDHGYRSPFSTLVTNLIPDLHVLASTDGFQCFPFYTYAEDGSNRRENITDWALAQFQTRYGNQVSKWDIFNYVYALLHHPQYRERYAENLKRELPRIPLLGNSETFTTLAQIGAALAGLHLGYEQAAPYPLLHAENSKVPFTWRVTKMRLTPDKRSLIVNDALTLSDIPPECFQYRLGNRSALEWVIDQYQVSTDPRSGITSEPNRADDPEYIVRLVKQVVTVSLETVKLVEQLTNGVTLDETQ